MSTIRRAQLDSRITPRKRRSALVSGYARTLTTPESLIGKRGPNRKSAFRSAQDGKAERTVAARKRGKAHGSARPHCLCDVRRHSGTVAHARQARGVRHCKSSGGVECSGSLCRRCRKTVRPFLQPCPCLFRQINRPETFVPNFRGHNVSLVLTELMRRFVPSITGQHGARN